MDSNSVSHVVSVALLEAQARLLVLREGLCRHKNISYHLANNHEPIHQDTIGHYQDCLHKLPAHLGWESQVITDSLRQKPISSFLPEPPEGPHHPRIEYGADFNTVTPLVEETPLLTNTMDLLNESVILYPDMALILIQRQLVASGRLWLLARQVDQKGQGWLSFEELWERFCNSDSRWRICGERQLRNLLKQGEEIFWTCRHNRLWLHSTAKVATTLGIERFNQVAVQIPVQLLLGKMGVVRAHFYATFHSSRIKESKYEQRFAPPIARITLEKLTHLSRQTQRRYEQLAEVPRLANFAVGCPLTPETEQQIASQHGNALFHFTDYAGKHGRAGTTYLAWQLPNSYGGSHPQQPNSQKRRLNRKLAVLWQKGTTGNDKVSGANQRRTKTKRFYKDGAQAAKSYNRSPHQDAYWKNLSLNNKIAAWWSVLPALNLTL